MTKEAPKKNPRVTISPEAYQALCIQAALEMLPPGTLASRMILSQAQEALQALQVTRREALPHKAQDQLPEKEKKALQEGKLKLSKNLQALAQIKELLAQTPRPSISQIAKEIGYPRGAVAGHVKQMTGSGEP